MKNPQSTEKVNNPKLTLYAFHLRNNLALGFEEPVETANLLWTKCEELGEKLQVPRLQFLRERLTKEWGSSIGVSPHNEKQPSDYLELLPINEYGKRLLHFSPITESTDLKMRGEIYALQIHDTYAIDLTLRYPYQNIDLAKIHNLNYKDCLLSNQIQASLGQTLVLFTQPASSIQNSETLAKNCVEFLLSPFEANKLLKTAPYAGKFLGSPIFEYESGDDNPSQNLHLLIWLNSDPETESLEAQGDYCQRLINLLYCRSRILYTYFQSRQCNQKARSIYKIIETKFQDFKNPPSTSNERLKQFKQLLTEMPQQAFDYANHLRDFEIYINTLETNAKNYRACLERLQEISLKDKDNLDFLQKFLTRTETMLIEQIRVDLGYLMPAQKLFDQMISTVRGIVEIEQAEREKSLERTIQILGTGLGAGGIIASAISGHITVPMVWPNHPKADEIHPAIHTTVWSLVAFLAFAGFTAAINGWFADRLAKRKRQQQEKSAKKPTGI
ncbi:hypothetical protein [Microcoleus sp. FACHB-672]|uniref:hypothetical protein n=1 Tax=Microcoleus sp. FACHB-672 TaxID=2692825 RepID=UPI0016829891|nr:hypothetical protein [Microcoleus sp. FACHB-672]MBD2042639.1 hypothetical protein [Microcoleus sp. FACHB-672]